MHTIRQDMRVMNQERRNDLIMTWSRMNQRMELEWSCLDLNSKQRLLVWEGTRRCCERTNSNSSSISWNRGGSFVVGKFEVTTVF